MNKKIDELEVKIRKLGVMNDNANTTLCSCNSNHEKTYSVNHSWFSKNDHYFMAIHTFKFTDEKRYIINVDFYEKKALENEELSLNAYVAHSYKELLNIVESTIKAFTII